MCRPAGRWVVDRSQRTPAWGETPPGVPSLCGHTLSVLALLPPLWQAFRPSRLCCLVAGRLDDDGCRCDSARDFNPGGADVEAELVVRQVVLRLDAGAAIRV